MSRSSRSAFDAQGVGQLAQVAADLLALAQHVARGGARLGEQLAGAWRRAWSRACLGRGLVAQRAARDRLGAQLRGLAAGVGADLPASSSAACTRISAARSASAMRSSARCSAASRSSSAARSAAATIWPRHGARRQLAGDAACVGGSSLMRHRW